MNLVVMKTLAIRTFLALCLLGSLQTLTHGQLPPEPERTQLLNGLRVLLWSRPGDEVLIKLRIHSGGAFDLAGKAGQMALLGDILFPDPTTREYFTDEMQGRLNVSTNYDSITITMQGRAQEFERIVEILRTALVTTQLTPENVQKIRAGRIKVIKDTSISSAMLADRAIAARLFGEFPYGRPYSGTVESLERVERPDLMLSRERFLNPNNATLVIISNVQPSRAKRALRQLLGVWRMSERLVPLTFRQPPAPDARTLIINAAGDQSVEVRLAVRGLARNDKDATAASLLSIVARKRWEKALPELAKSPVFVRDESFSLPGMFVMGATVDHLLAARTLATARETLSSLLSSPPSVSELEQARSEAILSTNKSLESLDGRAEAFLDVDTYNLPPVSDQFAGLTAISQSDLQRVATRLFKDAAAASLVVGNSELVKIQLESSGKVELLGEIDSRSPAQTNQGTLKPPVKPAVKPE